MQYNRPRKLKCDDVSFISNVGCCVVGILTQPFVGFNLRYGILHHSTSRFLDYKDNLTLLHSVVNV